MPVDSIRILAAMQLEANAVSDSLGLPRAKPDSPASGSFRGLRVCVQLIGVEAKFLIERSVDSKPDWLIVAGLSGGLDPSLQVGDVVIDGCELQRCRSLRCRRGRVTSRDSIISSPADKAACFAQTGALAIDMESERVRAWAAERQIPFVAIRSISDRADQTLDPAVLKWVDAWGRPQIGAALRSIVCKPRLIGHLCPLAINSKRAARSLGMAVRQALECVASDADPTKAQPV